MNSSHWVMLGLGIFYAGFAVVLVKAIRRKEWQRLFELVVMTLWASYVFLSAVSPAVIDNAWAACPPLRWLCLLSSLLLLANFFGFSGWLFNRHRKRQI